MAYTITFIPGDGIGPEVSYAAKKVIDATGIEIVWEIYSAGNSALEKFGTPLPEKLISSIKKNKVALKGPLETPIGKGFRSVNVELRKRLDLFCCFRPCKYYLGVKSRYSDVPLDIVVIRENHEDLYAGIEFKKGEKNTLELINYIISLDSSNILLDSGISIKPISETRSRRIIKYAFNFARSEKRKKVTAVHKANIMKFTDGLFLEVAKEISKEYPDIEFEDKIVDNMCMQLVQKPELYDVLVLPNLYGDIVSDLCSGLIGGLGVAPSANIGDNIALFEPVHGSAPKYTGLNKANPIATMLSGVLMLRHIGEYKAANNMENAIAEIISEGKYVTYDMKPCKDDPTAVSTSEVADAVIEKMTKYEKEQAIYNQ